MNDKDLLFLVTDNERTEERPGTKGKTPSVNSHVNSVQDSRMARGRERERVRERGKEGQEVEKEERGIVMDNGH